MKTETGGLWQCICCGHISCEPFKQCCICGMSCCCVTFEEAQKLSILTRVAVCAKCGNSTVVKAGEFQKFIRYCCPACFELCLTSLD